MVNRKICGNSPKPSSDSIAISQLRETFVSLNEDLLGNVFRIGQVPDYPGRDRKYHVLVVPDKCFKFLFLRHFSVQPTTRPLVEMGQGECCSCDHADRNFPGTRLKCEQSGRLQAFESSVERPPTEPKDEQRIDEPGCGLGFNRYPAALTCGGVGMLLWSEIDNIILHSSLLSFTDRTPLGCKKLQDYFRTGYSLTLSPGKRRLQPLPPLGLQPPGGACNELEGVACHANGSLQATFRRRQTRQRRRGLQLWFRRGGSLPKVSFDAPRFQDIAFAPQILVRWLSGRKRRFAKALYLKRVPRVRIPASPDLSKLFFT